MIKRVFLIVLDSLGVGALPDAKAYNDEGSNTLKAIMQSRLFNAPNLAKLGLFNIEGVEAQDYPYPQASFGRLKEKSLGKDTTVGHWEIAGLITNTPFPTYPNGFPQEIIKELEKQCNKKTLCNKPYSGTQVIKDYGREHIKTGDLIVYTSADSVMQIAAHEDVVPLSDLYAYCTLAREILKGRHAVGRVIARPFRGDYPNYFRTQNRQDYSLAPPKDTMLDILKANNKDVIAVGKINDIFAQKGITSSLKSKNNQEGMMITYDLLSQDFKGLCFTNLVDFDMLYGHRNDVDGYAQALSDFDVWLEKFLADMHGGDVLIITADHGCDPSTPSTDHSREYAPILIYGKAIKQGINLGTRESFADTAKTVLECFNLNGDIQGTSFIKEVYNGQ